MKRLLIIIALALPTSLQAATFTVSAKAGTETVNAIEGTLALPQEAQVESIHTGDSGVLLWITPPTWNSAEHSISFAGVTPGGFTGTKPLFTIELPEGSSARVAGGVLWGYRNDGKGTRVALEYSLNPSEAKEDREWPQPFAPIISSSPDILGGARFVSFAAEDKGTGIDHYEFASSWFLPPSRDEWEKASSPKELSFADLFKKIRIRAYDGAGYYREETIPGPYRYAFLGIGSIILACVLLLIRRSLRHSS